MNEYTNAVEVHQITKRFGKFVAVNQISFDIPRGEIFGLLGPNGAGKTTMIRMLCGMLVPDSGSASVLGYDVARNPEQVKRNIGYMSQRFSLYNDLTPVENLNFYADVYGLHNSKRAGRVDQLLELTHLVDFRSTRTGSLSGAWRQRLALACSVVHNPPMLFLDESTAGVDPVSRQKFWDLIYEYAADGVSVLATTHYLDEADYCNQVGMMYQGELITVANPDEIKNGLAGSLLRVDCDDTVAAAALLEGLHGVERVSVHGAQLHVTLKQPEEKIKVEKKLKAANISVFCIEQIKPSLEDTFIAMVEQRRIQGNA